MLMDEHKQAKQLIRQANKFYNKCQFSNKKILSFINYQLAVIQNTSFSIPCCNKLSHLQEQVAEGFRNAYKKLKMMQKVEFYLLNAKNLHKIQNYAINKQIQANKNDPIIKQPPKINFSIKQNKIYKKFTHICAHLEQKQKNIILQKNIIFIDLHQYLLRRSKNKKYKNCLVLQSTTSKENIYLLFTELDFYLSYGLVKKLWESAWFQNLQQINRAKILTINPRIDQDNNPNINMRNLSQKIIVTEQNPFSQKNCILEEKIIPVQSNNQADIKNQISRSKPLGFLPTFDQEQKATQKFEQEYLSEIRSEIQQFYSVSGSIGISMQNQADNKVDMDEESPYLSEQIKEKKYLKGLELNEVKPQHAYLKYYDQQDVLIKKQPKFWSQPEGHIIFGRDWAIRDNGLLVLVNKDKIKDQDDILKLMLKRIGKKIFSGNLSNLISTPFPIQSFNNFSQLQCFARSYGFAPKIIERAIKASNPVQRMVRIIAFSISIIHLYVDCQKAFNPILGETYQGMIDGCPVYGQQILHHPPVSSMLLIGRGYKINANLGQTVQMGLNAAWCRYEGIQNIYFQKDGALIKFNNPYFCLGGLAFGERTGNFGRTSYFIDEKNLIYCQLNWSIENGSFSNCKFKDNIEGKIVKLKPGTNINQLKKIRKIDIEQQYGYVHGRYYQKIYYKNEIIFEGQKQIPYLLESNFPHLQSDCSYRRDIQEYRKNNLQIAEQLKDQLQEKQRSDRKLRKQYQKKKY